MGRAGLPIPEVTLALLLCAYAEGIGRHGASLNAQRNRRHRDDRGGGGRLSTECNRRR